MIWHLYDWYLNPSSTFFAARLAFQPLHIQFSYYDKTIWVINSLYTPAYNLKANISTCSLTGEIVASRIVYIPILEADSVMQISDLEVNEHLGSECFFLRLVLSSPDSQVLSTNWYWLSSKSGAFHTSKVTNGFRCSRLGS